MQRRTPLIVSLVLVALAASNAIADDAQSTAEFVPGEIIVRWHATPGALEAHPDIQRLLADPLRRPTVQRLAGNTELLRFAGDAASTLAMIGKLNADPSVRYAQPNYIRRVMSASNDTHLPLQWNLAQMRVTEAWSIMATRPTVVAVIDTGIRAKHPDLAGQILPGYDFISSKEAANDGDGYDANPEDTGDNTTASSAFHGTHVAGVVAALTNNGIGIAGVAPHAKILPVRALGVKEGKGTDADIATAIRWAAGLDVAGAPKNANPADVINLSFGGPGASNVLTDAVTAALGRGAIVIAAAGNQNADVIKSDIHPAAIDGVIAVGATDIAGKRAPYSNYGTRVDIMAPGGNLGGANQALTHQGRNDWPAGIVSTMYYTAEQQAKGQPEFGYHFLDGTSQSAPAVAGVVAAMRAVNPDLDHQQVRAVLTQTANPSGKCNEGCGAGLIDAYAAIQASSSPPPKENPSLLPMGASCAIAAQCAGGLCIAGASGTNVCSKNCLLESDCGGSASCVANVCVFHGVSSTSSRRSPGQGGSTVTVLGTSGCALGSDAPLGDFSTVGLGLALALGLAYRGRRRRRHRR
ncbi:MAG: S8 family serine peptidase [Deltaproteobacteria bacterium]|nr:S8 family serine peptidase [Deltaproteobacteria bacterium]